MYTIVRVNRESGYTQILILSPKVVTNHPSQYVASEFRIHAI